MKKILLWSVAALLGVTVVGCLGAVAMFLLFSFSFRNSAQPRAEHEADEAKAELLALPADTLRAMHARSSARPGRSQPTQTR